MATCQAGYKAKTMQAYDASAAELARQFEDFFARFACQEAACFLAGLSRDETILDLGCGGGPASRYFAACGCSVVSADLSAGMLQECHSRGLQNLIRLDLEALPFRRCSFGGIWAHTSLLHVPKVRLADVLETVAEALKPGGRLFVALKEGNGQGYRGQPGLERWFSDFTQTEFEAYVPAGFEVVRRTRTALSSTTFLNYHLTRYDSG